MYYLKFKLTKNNVFISLKQQNGKALIWSSAGMSGFRGPSRATDFAAEQAGKRIGFLIKKKRIKNIIFILTSRVDRRIRAVIKGLCSFKIKIKKIIVRPKIAHNGVRLSKAKRK